jgi:hypothetical protein
MVYFHYVSPLLTELKPRLFGMRLALFKHWEAVLFHGRIFPPNIRDAGYGDGDPLHLMVENEGYRRGIPSRKEPSLKTTLIM